MEFELSFKQEHLLDYNISLNSFRFTTQKTAHRRKKANFLLKKQELHTTQMICNFKIMTRIYIQCLLCSTHCSGKKGANKLSCTLNTTTCTARTAYRYESPPTLPENSIITGWLFRDCKKRSLFSEHYIKFMLSHKFVITYISFHLCIYFTWCVV